MFFFTVEMKAMALRSGWQAEISSKGRIEREMAVNEGGT